MLLAAAARILVDCHETLLATLLKRLKLQKGFLLRDHFCWLFAVTVFANCALHFREAAVVAAEALLL